MVRSEREIGVQVAVVAAPDDVWRERVHAFVVMVDDASLDAEGVIAFT